MKFIKVTDQTPVEFETPNNHPLWIQTKMFGAMVGFYHNGKFMKNYACEIINVVAWLELPIYEQ